MSEEAKENHLCATCVNANRVETEAKKIIYVSYGCKFGDNDNDMKMHSLIITTPFTDHVIECPKYKNAPLIERVRRKLFWWKG